MPKFCIKCGNQLPDGVKFCPKCGTSIQQPSTQPTTAPIPPSSPEYQYQQTPIHTPTSTKSRFNKKLIFSLIAFVIIVIVVLVVVFVFLGSGADSRFVGDWEDNFGTTYSFKTDKSLHVLGIKVSTWDIKGDQICFTPVSGSSWGIGEQCIQYEFTNNGNTLTMTMQGVPIVLTKVSGGGISNDIDSSQFIGTWDVESSDVDIGDWTFYENSSLKQFIDYGFGEYTTWISWSVSGDKLFLEDFGDIGYTCQFSNGGNKLELKLGPESQPIMTLTKR
jgi:hypothetical protein